jgi:alpha-tubulin suppressor-like RCC1 family protein
MITGLLAAALATTANPAQAASYGATAWGANVQRQLGDGSIAASRTKPVAVSDLSGVTAIAAGQAHSLAVLSDGTVWAWGLNAFGQLGDGTNTTSSVPVRVGSLTGATAVAAGSDHSLALLGGGTVLAWGDNESGQLGDGTTTESLVPVAVKGLTGVTAIAAGGEHSLAVLSNGTVMAWGDGSGGQLGTGNTKTSSVPVAVKGITTATAVAAGTGFSLALLANGTVMAWGENGLGQLGEPGVEEQSDVPVAVSGLTGASAIAAGESFGLALVAGGAVQGWGADADGQLGNGLPARFEPAPVATGAISGASAIAAGGAHAMALTNGAVQTWGDDEWGELGNGTSGGVAATPVAVPGLAEVTGIAAGGTHDLTFGEPIPTVSAVTPADGLAGGGTAVTIAGANLATATGVRFGTNAAEGFSVEADGSIAAVAPPGTGVVDVTVTTPAGNSPNGPSDRFTYVPAPAVTKVSPNYGAAPGGNTVTITGTSLQGASAVYFGSTPATGVVVKSSTTISAVAPALGLGTFYVTVVTPLGTTPDGTKARYKVLPAIEALSPATGAATGGTPVTVTGSGFATGSTATVFKFGKTRATGVSCSSTTMCTLTAPAHESGTVEVRVTVAKLTSAKGLPASLFTYG